MEYMEQQMQNYIEAGITEADRCYARIAELEELNQELAATVEALKLPLKALLETTLGFGGSLQADGQFAYRVRESVFKKAESALSSTPQQHLAEIRAGAVEQFALHVSDNMDDGIDRAKLIILASERISSIRRGEVE